MTVVQAGDVLAGATLRTTGLGGEVLRAVGKGGGCGQLNGEADEQERATAHCAPPNGKGAL